MTTTRVRLLQPTLAGSSYGSGKCIYYGQPFTGRAFEHVEFVDPPRSTKDWDWIQEHLVPRLAPGATFCGRFA